MCRNFTYEVVGQRRRLKATIKNRTSKNKCQFIKNHPRVKDLFEYKVGKYGWWTKKNWDTQNFLRLYQALNC
jgi:hypothetical protein